MTHVQGEISRRNGRTKDIHNLYRRVIFNDPENRCFDGQLEHVACTSYASLRLSSRRLFLLSSSFCSVCGSGSGKKWAGPEILGVKAVAFDQHEDLIRADEVGSWQKGV
jgi:hypothetical protein